jgi:hypothetical protein
MKNKKDKTEAQLHPDQKFVVGRINRKQIKNAPYNPRQIDEHARKKLVGNITKKGLLEALVWNKQTGNLVSGHQRLSILDERAAKKGLSNYLLDVAIVDLNEKEEKEQNVFFNNPDAQGTYDVDGLGKLIADEEIDYKVAGFDDMTLQMMFEDTDYAVTMFDLDEAPGSVQRDIDEISKIQRMKRERKEHRERDIDANDPEFYAVVVFPDREAQGRFMERVGKDRNERYVDGLRLHSALEVTKPQTKTKNGEQFEALTFWVAKDQKQVIEDELVRISALLKGKNIRGRSLEAMAVISSQTPTDNITGEEPEVEKPEFKPRKKKRRAA